MTGARLSGDERGFDMDHCVQLSFDNVNAPEVNMGTELDNATEFEDLALRTSDAPTAVAPLD